MLHYIIAAAILAAPGLLYAWEGKVVEVPEGDTLVVLQNGRRLTVRLADIDCPEKGQPWSREARQFTFNRVFDKVVKVWPSPPDPQGSPRVFVFYKDKNLNRELVAAGLAWHFKEPARDPGFVALEVRARALKKGLWQDQHPMPPWEYRRRHAAGGSTID